jgi:FkbM family methyltransferase
VKLVTRRNTTFVAPLGTKAGALYPALEVFAFSVYAHDWRLEARPRVIDVGAHVGSFTLWLAEQYPDLRVDCFEPDPDAHRYLVANVAHIEATVHSNAVGAKSGIGRLSRPIPAGSISSLQPNPEVDGLPVEIVSFDRLMEGREEISLLKLDCEGSEYEIVLDTAARSWERVRRVIVEFHPVGGRSASELVQRLESLGLSLVGNSSTAESGIYWFSR